VKLIGLQACVCETDCKARSLAIVVNFNENIFRVSECSFDLMTYEERMNVCVVQ
jgi:hypothetical protein